MEGKFFYFKSKENGQVLRIEEACEGTRVDLGDKRGDLNELWYEDKVNNVIRTRLDDTLCLTVRDGRVAIHRFHTEDENQLWKVSGDRIVHTDEGRQGERGILTIMSDGDSHRRWDIVYTGPCICYIETFMTDEDKPGEQLVLDVSGEKTEPGTKVALYTKKQEFAENQLWFEDKWGYIHSRLEGFVLDVEKDRVVMNPYADNVETQQWVKAGNCIVNRNNPKECLDVKGGKNKKNATLLPYEYKGTDNQHWFFRYL